MGWTEITYRSLFAALLLLSPISWGAPHPATGTSMVTNPSKGNFFRTQGFTLGTEGTSWEPQEDQSLSRGENGTSWRFSNPKLSKSQAHLKTDDLKADLTSEAYAKRWIRDYSHLGLDLLGTRTFAVGLTPGVVVDLVQAKKNIQMRQAIFVRKKMAVVITCSAEKSEFNKALDECNRLIKNFSWVEPNSQKAF